MAEYEFGGNADAVDFDNVVVIRNFPVLSTESQSYFELLLEGPFLSSLGKVRTINTPTDLSPEQRSKGFSFVELSSAVECDYVVKAIQNFCWGPSHKLQARHFRGLARTKMRIRLKTLPGKTTCQTNLLPNPQKVVPALRT